MSVISSFSALPQMFGHITKRGAALIAAKVYASINALHELLSAGAPVGAERLLLWPHDHSGGSHRHGTALARNNVCSIDMGDIATAWEIQIGATGTWYRLDRSANQTAVAVATKGPANIVAYVSPGLDSSNTNVSAGNVSHEAKVLIYNDNTGATNTSVRWRNRTTGTYSSTVVATAVSALELLTFTDIPVLEGWNEFDIEVSLDLVEGGTTSVYILSVVQSETRASSQRESDGAGVFTAASKP